MKSTAAFTLTSLALCCASTASAVTIGVVGDSDSLGANIERTGSSPNYSYSVDAD